MTDMDREERLAEYEEHLKYSSRHPIEELNDIIND